MEKDNVNEEYYFSSQTETVYYWFQSTTENTSFESKHYCIDENHYITQPNWVVCEICNCIVRGKSLE